MPLPSTSSWLPPAKYHGLVAPVGFRVWVISDGRLRSPFVRHAWPFSGPLKAECARGFAVKRDKAHVLGCDCGIHAFYRLEEALEYAGFTSWRDGESHVVGAVVGHGGTLLCAYGFRSASGLPLALLSPGAARECCWFPGTGAAAGKKREALLRDEAGLVPLVARAYGLPLLGAGGLVSAARRAGALLRPSLPPGGARHGVAYA